MTQIHIRWTLAAILLLALALLIPVAGNAEEPLEVKGKGRIKYTFKIDKNEKNKAIEKAKRNVLDQYSSSLQKAELKNYLKIEEELKDNVDSYIVDYTIIDQDNDKKAKVYTVLIRALVDVTRIELKLQGSAGGTSGGEEELVFVFLARQATQVKSYDDRVVKRVDTDSTDDAEEVTAVDDAQVVSRSTQQTSEITTTGGSSTKKSDKIDWEILGTLAIDTAVNNVFSDADFIVVDPADVYIELDDFKRDFAQNAEIGSQTRRTALATAKAEEIPYFGMGYLEVDMKSTDPVTGNVSVFVRVNAQIYDLLSRKRPHRVASVGPVQYKGTGPSESVARTNALILAAESAARELTNQLISKGIR